MAMRADHALPAAMEKAMNNLRVKTMSESKMASNPSNTGTNNDISKMKILFLILNTPY